MTPSPSSKYLACLAIASCVLHFSCTKSSGDNHGIKSFTAHLSFLPPDQAVVNWTAATSLSNDTIRYKVLLDGKVVDSNLTGLTDTLNTIYPSSSYVGSVVA